MEEILAATRRRVEEARATVDMRALTLQAQSMKARGFGEALRRRATRGPAIVAEIKRVSPSTGALRGSYHVTRLARDFEAAGAAALAVLTEPDLFQGSIADMREAAAAVQLPILRRDFIVEEFQLVEAKVNGADAVSLMASMLDDHQLASLHARARTLGLDVLVEVRNSGEVTRAVGIGATIIGVDARDPKTFIADPDLPLRLLDRIPGTVVRVAESAIGSASQVKRLYAAGFEACLIGEALMRAEWPGRVLQEFLSAAENGAAGL